MGVVIQFPSRIKINNGQKVLAHEVELVLRLSAPSPALQGKAKVALHNQQHGLCEFSRADIDAFDREDIRFTSL